MIKYSPEDSIKARRQNKIKQLNIRRTMNRFELTRQQAAALLSYFGCPQLIRFEDFMRDKSVIDSDEQLEEFETILQAIKDNKLETIGDKN